MSTREKAIHLLDQIPDNQVDRIYNFMLSIQLEPNPETVAAIEESESLDPDDAFDGTPKEFINSLLDEE